MPEPITRHALAKLNLCLSVSPPNPPGTLLEGRDVSGYHPIASWMACIDLHDDITVRPLPAGERSTLSIAWAPDAPRPTPIDWDEAKDLSHRAHAALEARVAKPLPAAITLTKRIPVGAGLGGGSSDAAATLHAVNDTFGLGLDLEALRTLAADLGTDVPFFLDETDPPRPAIVTGLGEQVERVDPVLGEMVLVIPTYSCATREVYRAFDAVLEERVALKRAEIEVARGAEAARRYQPAPANPDQVRRRVDRARRTGEIGGLFNDLYVPATRVEPRLGRLATALARATHHDVHLTGSGSALFLIADARRAERLQAKARAALDSFGFSDDTSLRDAAASAAVLRAPLRP